MAYILKAQFAPATGDLYYAGEDNGLVLNRAKATRYPDVTTANKARMARIKLWREEAGKTPAPLVIVPA